MCPSAAAINGNGTNAGGEVPHVPTTEGPAPSEYQAVDSHAPSAPEVAEKKQQSNPYASRASDFLSNVSSTSLIFFCYYYMYPPTLPTVAGKGAFTLSNFPVRAQSQNQFPIDFPCRHGTVILTTRSMWYNPLYHSM